MKLLADARLLRWAPALLPALLLAACAGAPKRVPISGPPPSAGPAGGQVKIGKPYQVFGKTYVPSDDRDYDQSGIASWYGPGFHALVTANGETYDQDDVTAAHKTLPMPSWVEVTNLDNGRKLTVRVNDRGPFVDGRIIDLSRRSAQLLGVDRVGLARVRVRRVYPAMSPEPMLATAPVPAPDAVAAAPVAPVQTVSLPASPVVRSVELPPSTPAAAPARPGLAGVFIQVAALADAGRIAWLNGYLGVFGPVVKAPGPNGLTRMRLGPYASPAEAEPVLAQLRAAGYSEARIVRP